MAARKAQNLLEQGLRIAQASERSPQARVTALLRLAARSFGLSSATLYLPETNLDALTRRFSTVLPHTRHSCLIPFGHGCAGRAALSCLPQSSLRHEVHLDELTAADDACFLSLPIVDCKRLVGVLSLGCATETDSDQVAGISGELGPVFSLVLSELAARERAERIQRNMSILSSLGKLLNGSHPLEALLPQLLKLCTASGLWQCAVIRLTEEEPGAPSLYQSCRREARPLLAGMLVAEPSLYARALDSGVTYSERPGDGDVPCHAVCTPLGCNGKVLGALTLFGGAEVAETEQVELAETMARLLSCALTEAIGSRRILAFAQENEKKVKELSLLYRMSNTMLSTLKLNKLIHLTLTALTSGPTPFFDRAMLFLTNERSGVLVGMLGVTTETSPSLPLSQGGGDDILSSRWDISEEEMTAQRESEFCRQVMGKRLELDGSLNIAARSVLERRLIHIPGWDNLDPHGPALAASPLIAHGQAVGAVLVDNALTKAAMTQEELRYLQLFANQAGMAIENSMLYNKIEDANTQLREAQESLLQKERLAAIGEMAAGIAHELKGPLVSIGGFAGRLTKKLPQGSSEWGHADLIVREVLRLEGILSEILIFSKKATICYSKCNIAEIVRDSLAVVTPPLEEKQITVTTKFTRQKLLLLGDPQQLKQVFINILLNALDAMDSGGKLVIQVTAGELEGKEAVCVKISDTGGGIPLEALNSIFTPFYTTKESGTGLGLPIANRIITNHGGKIQISNNPGLGVEFRVILPKHW